jgi:hypothetical protein
MLTLLHTAESNIAVFDALWKEIAPDIDVRHLVADDILQEARDAGRVSPKLSRRVAEIYETLGRQFEFVLCTCSTIGEIAERESRRYRFPVLRVDRPMAERALALGRHIAVLATLKSTLEPTRELLKSVAHATHAAVQIDDVLVKNAWPQLESGDAAGYAQAIAEEIDGAARSHDVIVLAQASMAAAADLRPNCPIPILSSPRLGFEAAVAQYRAYMAVLQQRNAAASQA